MINSDQARKNGDLLRCLRAYIGSYTFYVSLALAIYFSFLNGRFIKYIYTWDTIKFFIFVVTVPMVLWVWHKLSSDSLEEENGSQAKKRKHLSYYLMTYSKSYTFYFAVAMLIYFMIYANSSLKYLFTFNAVFAYTLVLVFPIVPWIVVRTYVDEMERMRIANFDQYRIDHPENVSLKNRISCFACDGDRLTIRKIRSHTYMQEHVCTQCGETLYYSPEG